MFIGALVADPSQRNGTNETQHGGGGGAHGGPRDAFDLSCRTLTRGPGPWKADLSNLLPSASPAAVDPFGRSRARGLRHREVPGRWQRRTAARPALRT